MQSHLEQKIARIQGGQAPRVLDLFAGCGGFSLGFLSAGYEIVGAVEADKDAAKTFSENFGLPFNSVYRDIKKSEPSDVLCNLGPDQHIKEAVDVVVGGPPCQSFARIGRAKLRSQSKKSSEWSARAELYQHYIGYVTTLEPLVIVFENVPDILNYRGQNVAALICEQLEEAGYHAGCTLLNSVFYGVPQLRERLYLVAYHESLGRQISWPAPTHSYKLPAGYIDIRSYARKRNRGRKSRLNEEPLSKSWIENLSPLLPSVTTEQALIGLPKIFAESALKSGLLGRKSQKPSLRVNYTADFSKSQYDYIMRNWPNFVSSDTTSAHVIRCLPRDFRIFAQMEAGDQYPAALAISKKLFLSEIERLSDSGTDIKQGSPAWEELYSQYVPPYCSEKFPNKWRKMGPLAPSRTLMAHLGHDGYSHIHYDSDQARTISVREAARLQSFPDAFEFHCSMNSAFRQIGNAVPPLVSYALAQKIANDLEASLAPDFRIASHYQNPVCAS